MYVRSPEHLAIRDLLVELRKARFDTQPEFAKAAGWGKNRVERIESGGKIPNALEERHWAITCKVKPLAYYRKREKRIRENRE